MACRSEAEAILGEVNASVHEAVPDIARSFPGELRRALLGIDGQPLKAVHGVVYEYVSGIAVPLLGSNSQPERTYYQEKPNGPTLTGSRRQLEGAPLIEVDGERYWIHLRQSILADGSTASFVLEAQAFAPDPVWLAQIAPQRVVNWNHGDASRLELTGIIGAVQFIQHFAGK